MNRKKPNIIFLLSDDHGAWALGSSGNKEIITPNLDKLAAEGLRFENFFCASPVCSPARATLLTGRIPSQHGVLDWIKDGNEKQGEIEYMVGQTAYTDLLAKEGYVCGLSGKWHLGKSSVPQKSFSHWFAHKSGGGPYYGAPFYRDGKLGKESGYVTDVITDDAIGFLRERAHKEPFYLHVGYTAPHSPWVNNHPKEYTDLYKDCPFLSCPMEGLHPDSIYLTEEVMKDMRANQIGYYAAVTAMDSNIGRILSELDSLGIREETMVIFSGDNGFSCGHHGFWGKGNGTFPINLYESSVKVPLIVNQPGVIKPGRSASLVSGYDFMPTILDYAGIRDWRPEEMEGGTENVPDREQREGIPKRLPGKSFLPAILGQPFEQDEAIVVMDEYGPNRMIRGTRYKFIKRYPYGPNELYDLLKDPGERNNLLLTGEKKWEDLKESMDYRLEQWYLKYVNPQIDGAKESVYGCGQVNLAGLWSQGETSYGCDEYIDKKLKRS